MTQSKTAILDRKIKILNMILTSYRSMNHHPSTPTSETVDNIMFITDWISELEQEKNML